MEVWGLVASVQAISEERMYWKYLTVVIVGEEYRGLRGSRGCLERWRPLRGLCVRMMAGDRWQRSGFSAVATGIHIY